MTGIFFTFLLATGLAVAGFVALGLEELSFFAVFLFLVAFLIFLSLPAERLLPALSGAAVAAAVVLAFVLLPGFDLELAAFFFEDLPVFPASAAAEALAAFLLFMLFLLTSFGSMVALVSSPPATAVLVTFLPAFAVL
ncbi:hypothetical protein [Hyphomicrobium sp. 2TAF46]|uniref:hypothetical protein n=1 Tax=Hyphomicrobium sp. 2TAF46 TaxID=3233019 RepID=UPI003F908146